MTAYLRSLNVLRENVRAHVRDARAAVLLTELDPGLSALLAELDGLLKQLDADVREVRADIEALIEGGTQW